jgi:hypothetical protein
VLDTLLVANGVWFSYLCRDTRCCPSQGRPMPHAPIPFAAVATVAGLTVASTRADLEGRFEPDEGRDRTYCLTSAEMIIVRSSSWRAHKTTQQALTRMPSAN